MSYDCMGISKHLGMAFTSTACTSHMLSRIEKGTTKASVVDVRGGLITAAGVLANAPIDKYKNEALKKKFEKVSRSVDTVDKALKKVKEITPEIAALYRAKLDKVHTKIADLWNDVRDSVCKGKG